MAETKTRAARRGGTKAKPKRAKPRKASKANTKKTASEAHRNGHALPKAPLLAGGAAMAGAAAGLAVGASRGRKTKVRRRPMMKIRSKDLVKATRDVGRFGLDVGQLAAELRRNREQAHGTNGAKRRSPVEVVLEGLTHRA